VFGFQNAIMVALACFAILFFVRAVFDDIRKCHLHFGRKRRNDPPRKPFGFPGR
jgi:hypothetical protein